MGVICQRWVRVRRDEKEGSCQLCLGGFDLRWPCYLSGDITLPTKVHIVQAIVFLAVMHGYESWTIKKTEHQRTDAFTLWCWRRLLRVPWTARSSNQSIIKEINPECSLEGLMLKLKLQYFGRLMWRAESLEKTVLLDRLKAGGESDDRTRWLGGNMDSTDMGLSKFWETVKDRAAWRAAVHGASKNWTYLSDWTAASKGLPWRLSGWRICNAGDVGLIPGLGRCPGEGTGTPPQCSCLGNPRDRGAWQATAHELAKRRTRLSH